MKRLAPSFQARVDPATGEMQATCGMCGHELPDDKHTVLQVPGCTPIVGCGRLVTHKNPNGVGPNYVLPPGVAPPWEIA